MVVVKILYYLLVTAALVGWTAGQKRTKVGTSIAGSEIEMAPDFECPEEFGYYPAPNDCTRYYVCVFGGALLESCTGGLVYSHELQTCDWPRNVGCLTGADAVAAAKTKASSRPSNVDQKLGSPLTQFLDSENSRTSRIQTSPPSTASRTKTNPSPITFELLGDVAAIQDNRQGRDFQGTSQRSNTVQQGGSSRNNLAGENPKSNSFNSRSQAPLPEDLPADFVQPTTFNPTARFSNRRSVVFRHQDDERMDGHRRHDYNLDDNEDDTLTSTGFTVFNRNLERNVARGKQDSDDETFWRFDDRSQHQQPETVASSKFRESIPSMHFSPINANSQRSVFEHMNHGPVPVRGAQLQGGHRSSLQPMESRQSQHNTAGFQSSQTVAGRPTGQFNSQQQHFQQSGREPAEDGIRGSHPFRQQQQFPHGPATSFLPHPNNRPPNRPHLTGTSQFNSPHTDSFDGSNDEQQQPHDWNQRQQAQQTLRPRRPPIESRVPVNNDQFHRETTTHVTTTTEATSFMEADFDQWDVVAPPRQAPRPSAPSRSSAQVQRPSVAAPVEDPVVAEPPRGQSDNQFSQQQDTLADVDYRDEFPTSEPTIDQFADYELFEDPNARPQEEFFEPPVVKTPPTTTTTTSTTTTTTTTTTTPKPLTRGANRGKPAADRGASRFRPFESSHDESSASSPARRRPTLKPVSDLVPSKPVDPIDIFKHPPRRLEPIFPQPTPDEPAARCNADVCRLPDCYCGGKDIPGGLRPIDTPQLVLLTFDDAVNDLNKELYGDLFETGRLNPNGCPIAATFYVSHEWTDYGQVQSLYADGHEIASHTISHSFGEQFPAKKWAKEAAGQRDVLAAYGGVRLEDIRGLRAPFLSVGGNRMFKMLYDMNFTYDSSMPVYENKPPSWPYTLDYKIFHDCMIPPCPTKSYPGVWEVPMVMWQDLNGGRCSMGDGCSNPPDAEGVYKMLIKNFERHYTTNRAPFPLYYHAAWFTTPHHKEGFEAFLDTIVAMDDVWLVTNWQAIQWVRDPTPLDRIKSFKPFNCDYPERPKRCNASKVCNAWHKSGVRYMRTCQPCPEVFPWTGKTGVKNPFLDHYGENEVAA